MDEAMDGHASSGLGEIRLVRHVAGEWHKSRIASEFRDCRVQCLTIEIKQHDHIMAVGQTLGDRPSYIAGSTGYHGNLMRHGGSPTRMRAWD